MPCTVRSTLWKHASSTSFHFLNFMMRSLLVLIAQLATSAAAGAKEPHWSDTVVKENANHIFNSVHDSLRQWGSSLHHNGMSMFFTTVPVSTELYHGTSSPYRVNQTEWLAFEPEHALMFARSRPPPKGPPHHKDDTRNNSPAHRMQELMLVGKSSNDQDHEILSPNHNHDNRNDGPRQSHPARDDKPGHGYLHTYRTRRTLHLLYVDGQSAAKSGKGTLDLQDLVIRDPDSQRSTVTNSQKRPHGGPMNEWERALELCHLAESLWERKIDGILRMEAGFEIILCSFEDNLDVVSIKQQQSQDMGDPRSGRDDWSYYQAVAARFDGIGGHRARVDFDSFLTAFAYPNCVRIDDAGLPRVTNDTTVIKAVRSDLRHMLTTSSDSVNGTDWQAITDLIVARYAGRIAYLASDRTGSLLDFQGEVDRALRPFIDYAVRNDDDEIARCASQFLSPEATADDSIAAIAVRETYLHICTSLVLALESKTHEEGLSRVRELKQWLGWATWKKCNGCVLDEVCMIPIWPWGSKADFDHPRCSNSSIHGRGDYWD